MSGDAMLDAFFEEAAELLAGFEAGLLELESAPDDKELLNRIFRCAHTLKGNSSMLGFDRVAHFTHALEDMLDQLRKGDLEATPVVIDTLLASADIVKGLVEEAKGGDAVDGAQHDKVHAAIKAIVKGETPAEVPALVPLAVTDAKAVEVETAPAGPSGTQKLYEIRFTPPEDVFRRGLDPIKCLEALAERGQFVQCSAETGKLPAFEQLDPEKCYLAWKIWLLSAQSEKELRSCFDFIADDNAVAIELLPMDDDLPAEEPQPQAKPQVANADQEPPTQAEPAGAPVQAPVAKAAAEKRAAPPATAESSSIRVSTDKVDKLINLVGEMVIVQSMINQVIREFSPDKLYLLQEAVTDMERNTRELQERVMAVRMLPISNVFSRFPRLVRDLAGTFQKKINLQVIGEETELDKGVIERIGDPLTHLIRNAVDHGVDTPEERKAAGKPETGTIKLHAYHQGGNVVIDVVDDGRGLNKDKIKQKAISQGLITADENLSDDQVHGLIFKPGFSTAAVISDVSGRGVGMDVVKRNVEELNGSVSILSEQGKGTTFRIKLPLTLAILDGLCLQVGKEVYILPLISIVESIQPKPQDIKTAVGKGEVVVVRGEFLPLVRLHKVFHLSGHVSDPSKGLVVIIENEGEKVGVLVDELLGQQQVVIKSLESNFQKTEGVVGATVMGDGRVALIVDVAGIVALARARGVAMAA